MSSGEIGRVSQWPALLRPFCSPAARPFRAAAMWKQFSCSREACLTLQEYATRVMKYARVDPILLETSFAILCRMMTKDPIRPSDISTIIHKAFLTATYIAHKFWVDEHETMTGQEAHSTAFWAKVGGVSSAGLKQMELCALRMIDWRVYPIQNKGAAGIEVESPEGGAGCTICLFSSRAP